MNVTLTPELEQFVEDKLKNGLYETAGDVVRDGLRLLLERDERLAGLRRDVRAGFASVESGNYSAFTEAEVGVLAERVKARGRQRLSELGFTADAQ